MSNDLIDLAYEAAFIPELWPGFLRTLADRTGSREGGLVLIDGDKGLWMATESCAAFLAERLAEQPGLDLYYDNLRAARVDASGRAGFLSAHDLLSPDELDADPYQQFLRADGLEWQALTRIPLPTGQMVGFSVERDKERGPYGADDIALLDATRPHLARAGMMAARLQLERAQATVAALSALGLPAAILSPQGRVLAANATFEAFDRLFLPVAFGGMAIADPDANRLFQEIVAASRSICEPFVRSIPARSGELDAPTVIHVLPLRRAARDIFSGGDLLVVATQVSPDAAVPGASLLSALFDLSPAEARLAGGLATGKPLKDIALDMNVSFGSARTYLARVFAKTGTNQQSQLVALLKSVQPMNVAPRADTR